MEFHPLSNLFPLMHGEAFEALKRDISANGLREPITTFEGQVLDGRNRWRACAELGLPPSCVEWAERSEDDSPSAFALSMNVDRRHLDESQRAMIADRLATLPPWRPGQSASKEALSQEEAADRLSVARASVQRARVVREKGIPALAEAVENGIIPVTPAAQVAELSPETQKNIIDKISSGTAKNVMVALRQIRLESHEQPPMPPGKVPRTYADPPWFYTFSILDGYGPPSVIIRL